ncbi:MAG TPA: hypothetical protein VEI96_13155 [Thermodesulfovibrionales bacterium]|nr:hypothetical protein [Thermodesulfovibrionales bacterium]
MRMLRYLIRSITVINIILVAILVAGAIAIFSPPRRITVAPAPPPRKAEAVRTEPPAQSTVPSPMDYTIIAEQNLFHPERKIPVEKPAVPPPPKPEFVLYGTLITDDTGIAYMDDKKAPSNSPGRGKRQTTLRKGENLSGFTLKEVSADKVVMVRGEETMVVNLIDSSSPKTREAPAAPAPAPGAAPGPFQPAAAQQATSKTTQPAQQAQKPSVSPAQAPAQSSAATSTPSTQGTKRSGGGLFGNIFKR